MIVSATERGVFRRCRRQWDLSSMNRQGIEPVKVHPALALGRLVHESMAGWLDQDQAMLSDSTIAYKPLAELFSDSATNELKRIMAAYREHVHVAMSESELEPFNALVELGYAMMKNYEEKYKTPVPEGFKLIATEQKVLIPIPQSTHYLECQFDGLIQHLESGRVFVLEHKTYERRPSDEHLQMNDQFLTYIWAANQLEFDGKKFPVSGIAYNGMWKRATPPRGRVFDDLFLRKLLIRPVDELNELAMNLRMELEDMANEPYIYPNRSWMGCFDCQFERLCATMSRGEDVQYALQSYKKRDTQLDVVDD